MKKIDISTKKYPGTYALVDDEDYERINKWKWYPNKAGYAVRDIHTIGYQKLTLRMHREILRYVGGKEIDHKNAHKLDNQKNNLRICTHRENLMNKRIQSNNKSGFKGVSLHKNTGLWVTQLSIKGKRRFVKYYKHKLDAAKAYNEVAKEYFGEYAHLNIIKEVV